MQSKLLLEKYPIQTLNIPFDRCAFESVDAIIEHLRGCIEADPIAGYIALFDHYAHTASRDNNEIAPEIKEAKNIIFCFGQKLPSAEMLAVRPRSIGVARTDEGFTCSFMEAPMAPMNDKMVQWIEQLQR